MHEAYRPISLMTALWPTQDFQFPADPCELARRLCEVFPLFNEQGTVAPLADENLQQEWPRLVLLGEQRMWALELAPGKVSLRRSANQPLGLAELFEAQHGLLGHVHAWLAENLGFRVYRMGMMIEIFCNTRSSANEKISQYFLHPRALQGQTPYEVQLGILSRVHLYGTVMVNRWLRVRPLRTIDPRRVDFAAQIEVDLNTLPEDTQVRTARDLSDFLNAACRHVDQEIALLADGEFVG